MAYGRLAGKIGLELSKLGLTASLLPQPAKQQRCADALAGEPIGIARLELREDDGAFGVAGDRGGEPVELAGGDDDLLAAEILDDALLGAAVLAYALDEVQVGVAVDALLADKHAELAADNKAIRQAQSAARPHNL